MLINGLTPNITTQQLKEAETEAKRHKLPPSLDLFRIEEPRSLAAPWPQQSLRACAVRGVELDGDGIGAFSCMAMSMCVAVSVCMTVSTHTLVYMAGGTRVVANTCEAQRACVGVKEKRSDTCLVGLFTHCSPQT